MRAFLAIELPEAVRRVLAEEARLLRHAGGRASWVRPENMHLTLRFLGECDGERLAALTPLVSAACGAHPAPSLSVAGLGAFPTPARPSVVWAGIRVLSGDLKELQGAIEKACTSAGFTPDDKPFHPHVTLARVRGHAAPSELARALNERIDAGSQPYGDEFTAAAVALFSSELKPGGPVYTRLAEHPVGHPCQKSS